MPQPEDAGFLEELQQRHRSSNLADAIHELQEFDPNFSEILFVDFAYSLYSQVHEARGRGNLSVYQPYVHARALSSMEQLGRGTGKLTDVSGVIVGGARIDSIQLTRRKVEIRVAFETNYTEHRENTSGDESFFYTEPTPAFYCEELWTFSRELDVLSPTPSGATRIGCPNCGSALETDTNQACAHCHVSITPGHHHWSVSNSEVLRRDLQPPTLTTSAPEFGTDLPTVMQPNYTAARQRFMTANPDFTWGHARDRFRHIFLELQQAWTTLDWERSRPYETDLLFQSHYFWIEEYRRQGLRNVLDDVHVEQLQPVKLGQDAFFDAITIRVFANMKDSTVNSEGRHVCGDPDHARRFSEYWTFVRRRGIQESAKATDACPSCSAPLKINMAGVCEYCQCKISSGEFDWVLSRIEQDDVYSG